MNKVKGITIQDLRDYRSLCAALKAAEDELASGKQHVVDTVQTAANFPYWKHVIAVEGDIYLKNPDRLKKEIVRMRDKKAKIERFVLNIYPMKVQRIAAIYYLEPAYGEKITWEYIADILNDGSTGDSCRMMLRRYLLDNCSKV